MDKYQIPKCDCGGELFHWQEEMHTILTPITQKGKLSKKSKNVTMDNGAWQRLRCDDCYKEYDYSEDNQGRIIRGDKWD